MREMGDSEGDKRRMKRKTDLGGHIFFNPLGPLNECIQPDQQ